MSVVTQGRRRCYRLKGADVATVIEALSQAVRYDHLAGPAGVVVFDALIGQRIRVQRVRGDRQGPERFTGVGVDIEAARVSRRRFAGHCLDWTERRPI